MFTMRVWGCTHQVVGPVVQGSYHQVGHHHGKPRYTKTERVGCLDVHCYWWDGDGDAGCGWWFSPEIGGNLVWAFNPIPCVVPPRIGWMVSPNNGTGDFAMDSSMVLAGMGIGWCNFPGCQQKAADYCANSMCGDHCDQGNNFCERHRGEWQCEQNALKRAERAPRRRGGKRSRRAW
jgi:hypothetical protein